MPNMYFFWPLQIPSATQVVHHQAGTNPELSVARDIFGLHAHLHRRYAVQYTKCHHLPYEYKGKGSVSEPDGLLGVAWVMQGRWGYIFLCTAIPFDNKQAFAVPAKKSQDYRASLLHNAPA